MRKKLRWLALAPFAFFAALLVAVHVSGTGVMPGADAPKVIVVLGARVMRNGTPSPALEARARRGAELFHQLGATKIFFSGGIGAFGKSEASVARDVAVSMGVPADACVLEEKSHSTLQNAEFTAPMLKEIGATRVVLVTDGFHLFRATRLFRDVGIQTQPVASGRPMTAAQRGWSTFREALAVVRRPWLLWS